MCFNDRTKLFCQNGDDAREHVLLIFHSNLSSNLGFSLWLMY